MNKITFRTVAIILCVLLVSLTAAGCSVVKNISSAQAAEETSVPPVSGQSGIIAEGRLMPRDYASLSFAAAGDVAEVLVGEGDTVTQGQVLARLGDREQAQAAVATAQLEHLNAQQQLDTLNEKAPLASGQASTTLAEAEKQLINAKKALDDLDTNDYSDKIDDAHTRMTDAKTELDDAQEEFDKYKDLDEENASRKRADDALEDAQQKYDDAKREYDLLQNALDQARSTVSLAQATYDDARTQADARQTGPDPDDLALAQSRLANSEAQLAAAQAALDNLELVAPYDGTVIEVNISANERATPTLPAFVIADLSQWYVETTDLTELDVVKVDAGSPVTITPDALEDLQLSGTVDKIAQGYKEKAGDILYRVRIRLDDTDPRLRWGMTVEVTFREISE